MFPYTSGSAIREATGHPFYLSRCVSKKYYMFNDLINLSWVISNVVYLITQDENYHCILIGFHPLVNVNVPFPFQECYI